MSKKLIIGLIAALIILGAAKFLLPSLSNLNAPTNYLAAPPHYGPLIVTMPAKATFKDQQGEIMLSGELAPHVSLYQNVILYNQDELILPLGGRIEKIEDGKAIMSLPEQTQTDLLSENVRVITFETIGSKRVPLTALQEDENGKLYVWVLEEENNNVRRYDLEIAQQDDNYFVEKAHDIRSRTHIIINPDNKIKAGKEYDIQKTTLNAPLHNPTKQAWIDFVRSNFEAEQEELRQRAQACRDGTLQEETDPKYGVAPDGSNVAEGACGLPAGYEEGMTPLDIFKSLTENPHPHPHP